tara:strand:- start:577 stop:1062 length:486 start_codon:yes stop_codon:yes gene_type:complete
MVDSGDGKPDAGEAKKVSKVDQLANQVAQIVEAVGVIAGQVATLTDQVGNSQPGQLSTTVSPEAILARSNDIVEVRKQLGQTVDDSQFRTDDIVQMAKGTDYAARVRAGLKLADDDELPVGIVINRLYQRRDKRWKYKVLWKAIGRDGCLEDEMVLVSRPS